MNKELLKRAIQIADNCIDGGGGPFGAIIVRDGEIIAEGSNQVTKNNDPTAHAEIIAIRAAAEKLGTWDLSGCELYSSCEPCPMCLGAIYWAHIDQVYFAATHDDAKDAGFDDADLYDEIKKDSSLRSIQMKSALREDSIRILVKWKEKQDKNQY